ncbi:efflux RND transporter periplasmic adaptor subunit [Acidithiobacillus acidisediminis]|uniref:efflux RND transporter periplasmic adaptor subunit n=1 Tax=Acidithiobacillus acidisediminis TaxID=2937799 RepID=UPI0020107967|nr:HlyD family efflux transporter periplasmic adaptor subunit [Acidithiobacillus sp. S30A2]
MPDIAIPQKEIQRRKNRRWLLILLFFVLAILSFALLWWFIPNGPSVSRNNLLLGTVQQGKFVVRIRAPGDLKARDERWITSRVGGTIESLLVHPGSEVHPQSPLLRLQDPTLHTRLIQAQSALAQARASAIANASQLEDQLYSLKSTLASARSAATSAKMELEADSSLMKEHVISRLRYETDQLHATDTTRQVRVLQERVAVFQQNIAAQAQGQQAVIASQQASLAAVMADMKALRPTAPMTGIVQDVSVHAGQQIAPGTAIARIANQQSLEAMLAVSPGDAEEISRQLPVQILVPGANAQVIAGRVSRVSPNVVHGSVPVTVELLGTLPKGVRPDLAVTGVIRARSIPHTLYVSRPVGVEPNSVTNVYVLSAQGDRALRREIRVGAASSSSIQVLSGLRPGEQIVLSNTEGWGKSMRVRT